MGDSEKPRFAVVLGRQLGAVHYFALSGFLLALLFVVHVGLAGWPLGAWFWEQVMGPSIEREFGFTSGERTVPGWHPENTVMTIEKVEPQGVFDRAGVRPGDVPWYGRCSRGYAAGWFHRGLALRSLNRVSFVRGIGTQNEKVVLLEIRR